MGAYEAGLSDILLARLVLSIGRDIGTDGRARGSGRETGRETGSEGIVCVGVE